MPGDFAQQGHSVRCPGCAVARPGSPSWKPLRASCSARGCRDRHGRGGRVATRRGPRLERRQAPTGRHEVAQADARSDAGRARSSPTPPAVRDVERGQHIPAAGLGDRTHLGVAHDEEVPASIPATAIRPTSPGSIPDSRKAANSAGDSCRPPNRWAWTRATSSRRRRFVSRRSST